MAAKESNIATEIRCHASKLGNRLWKNTRGNFYAPDIIPKLWAAVKAGLPAVIALLKSGRLTRVSAGLNADGSADEIGYTAVKITPAMVGRVLPILTSIEVKTDIGTTQDNQDAWLTFMKSVNAVAGVARSPEDYENIIKGWLSEMG